MNSVFGSASGKAVSVSISSHGIALTLSAKRRSYPRNSVLEATVRAANVSSHRIEVALTPPSGRCPAADPAIWVENPQGTQRFGPEPFASGAMYCPQASVLPVPRMWLRPGDAQALTQYVFLRSSRLRAVFTIWDGRQPVTIATPPLKLRLVSDPAPRATVHGGTHPYAVVTPRGQVRGPLLAAMWTQCRSGFADTRTGMTDLTEVNPRHVAPLLGKNCGTLLSWKAVVGWENGTTARFQWKRSR